MAPQFSSRRVRFGVFELDLEAGELRKGGVKIKLQGQPFQILVVLLEHSGAVVTREQLRQQLWSADTFVDFEDGLNTGIKKIRQALGDVAENPRFIETLPRKGYRFIAPLNGGERPPSASAPRRRRSLLWAATACIVLVAVAAIAWLIGARGTTPQLEPAPVPLASYPGFVWAPSFSPDGNQVAFLWGGDIYVKLIGKDPPLRLTSNGQGGAPAWSPDGRSIAYQRPASEGKPGVFLIPVIGGPERQVAETSPPEWWEPVVRTAWHPNGHWLVVPDRASPREPHALFLLSVETGEKRRLTSPPLGIIGDIQPAVSPDGSAVVFARGTETATDLYLLEISETLSPRGEPKPLTSDEIAGGESPAWMPDGRAILFTYGAIFPEMRLWKLPLSQPGWRPGKAQRLAFCGEDVHHPAVSRQGQLAYEKWTGVGASIWRLELSGTAAGTTAGRPPVQLIASSPSHLSHTAQYSPAGRRIAFASNRSGSDEIWVCDADGSNATQLTSFHGGYTASPRWSPDGKWIAFPYRRSGSYETYVVNSDGGVPHRLGLGSASSWSRDGKWIYFHSNRTGELQVWKMRPDGREATQVTKEGGGNGVESSDGKILYYMKGDEDAGSIWAVPVRGGKEVQLIDSVYPRGIVVVQQGIYFASDSHQLKFFNFAAQKSATLAKFEEELGYGLSVSPDDRWLLCTMSKSIAWSELMLVENFR